MRSDLSLLPPTPSRQMASKSASVNKASDLLFKRSLKLLDVITYSASKETSLHVTTLR